jgi:hypothetical protein
MLNLAKTTTGDAARPLAVEAAANEKKKGKRSLRVEKRVGGMGRRHTSSNTVLKT